MRFRDKVVWITGASSGIGEALAYAFYEEGANLILSARRKSQLERVMSECKNGEGQIYVQPLDMNQTEKITDASNSVIDRLSRIDILVNCAGIAQRSSVLDAEMHVFEKIMQVNFFGAVALTKAVLPSMVHRSSGQIVIIGSPAGLFGTPLRSGYAASKHAVHGFFDCLRAEVAGNGIFVTNVIPGPIRTNMSISSLTGDGDTYGIMDKFMENGISPADCANRTLTGIAQKKEEVYVVTPALRRMLLIRRFFPRWFSKLAKDMAPR